MPTLVEPAVSRERGCLPAELHGPLRASRGAWRLYDNVSGDALLLEHDGPLLRIRQPEVARLRARVGSSFVVKPIHGFGSGLCDVTVRPSRGVCMGAHILPDADVFIVAERLDRALGPEGAAACYGVTVHVGPMGQFL